MYAGSFIGIETLHKEYKEICLNGLEKYFDDNDFKKIYKPDECDFIKSEHFNSIVIDNTLYKINEYLAKYIASFNTSNIEGSLYFGVTDDGVCDGVPYIGNDFIVQMYNHINDIINTLHYNIKGCDDYIIWLKQNLKYEICELEYNETILTDDYLEELKKIENKYNKINNNWVLYETKYNIWLENVKKYSKKLNSIFNDMELREILIRYCDNYIIENNINYDDVRDAIEFIRSYKTIDYNITFEVLKGTNNSLNRFETWLIMFKDYMSDYYKKIKPQMPILKTNDFSHHKFYYRVSNIRKYLKKYYDVKFYVIKFDIGKNTIYKNIEYRKGKIWKKQKRIVSLSGPITIDL